jgi:hypothetical protein
MESDSKHGDPAGVPTTSDAPENNLTPVKDNKTAEELAAMIRQDLSKVDGCPSITVALI